MYENENQGAGFEQNENAVMNSQNSMGQNNMGQNNMNQSNMNSNYINQNSYYQNQNADENRYFDRLSNATSNYDTYRSVGQERNNFEEQTDKKKKKEKKPAGPFKKAVAAIGLGLAFGGCAGVGFYGVCQVSGISQQLKSFQEAKAYADKPAVKSTQDNITLEEKEVSSNTVVSDLSNANVVSTDVSSVVDRVMPAMVSIINNSTEEMMSFWGQTYSRDTSSSGSGIIIAQTDDELLLVTNHHVAADATKLEVTFIDGNTAEAKIKGMDAEMDLAVIAVNLNDIEAETMDAIAIAKLGNSDDLKLGKPVVVIGNALGYGQSVTNGIISGLDRELESEDGTTGTFIQTNAAVNPGNSGGALLNIDGEVIGIVSNKIGGSAIEGMGYAIPISSANPIIDDLKGRQTKGEKVDRADMGYLGVSLQEVTADARNYYNMPAGVYVYEVTEDSAAEKAGIRKGDIITKFDGERINSYSDLQNSLQYFKAGDTVKVTISRQEDGEYTEQNIEIELGKRPEE